MAPTGQTRGRRRAGHLIVHGEVQLAGHVPQPDVGGGSSRVLVHIGQRLLDQPVRGALGRRVQQPGGARRGQFDPHTGRARLVDQPGQVGQGRLRRTRRGLLAFVDPQHAEYLAQLVQRLPADLADEPDLAGVLAIRHADFQGSGVDDHQADPMGDHIMHLPGDPRPLFHTGLRRQQVLLTFEAFGLLPQVQHHRPPRPHIHAGQDRHDREKTHVRKAGHQAHDGELTLAGEEYAGGRGDGGNGGQHRQGAPAAAVLRQGVQADGERLVADVGRYEQNHRGTQPRRPAPPHHQRQPGQSRQREEDRSGKPERMVHRVAKEEGGEQGIAQRGQRDQDVEDHAPAAVPPQRPCPKEPREPSTPLCLCGGGDGAGGGPGMRGSARATSRSRMAAPSFMGVRGSSPAVGPCTAPSAWSPIGGSVLNELPGRLDQHAALRLPMHQSIVVPTGRGEGGGCHRRTRAGPESTGRPPTGVRPSWPPPTGPSRRRSRTRQLHLELPLNELRDLASPAASRAGGSRAAKPRQGSMPVPGAWPDSGGTSDYTPTVVTARTVKAAQMLRLTFLCSQNTATNSRMVALGQKYFAVGEPST